MYQDLRISLRTLLALHLIVLLGTMFLAAKGAYAVESDTTPVFALRLSKALEAGSFVDATFSARVNEGFVSHEREMFELRYGKRIGSNEFSGAYNLQFDRNGAPGSEHRLWQQFRHQFVLPSSNFESSIRLEERYFETNNLYGNRLRVLNRWNKTLPDGHLLRLGYEWVYNANYISRTTPRGVSQNRLIASLQHNFSNGDRLEFEYQMRYLHIPLKDNRIQNQLQLTYVASF